MTATQPAPNSPDKIADDWQTIAARAPRMASTMGRYLTQASSDSGSIVAPPVVPWPDSTQPMPASSSHRSPSHQPSDARYASSPGWGMPAMTVGGSTGHP